MLARLRKKLSYANVVATLALFVALGGSSYAALSVSGRDVRDRSLTGRDIKPNSLTGRQVKEGRLGTVGFARNSARVGGITARRLLLKCPSDTLPATGVCVETKPREPAVYSLATRTCAETDTNRSPGRRLPTEAELRNAFSFDALGPIAPGGELLGEVYPSSARPGGLDVLVMTTEAGEVAVVPAAFGGERAFRCVTSPLN